MTLAGFFLRHLCEVSVPGTTAFSAGTGASWRLSASSGRCGSHLYRWPPPSNYGQLTLVTLCLSHQVYLMKSIILSACPGSIQFSYLQKIQTAWFYQGSGFLNPPRSQAPLLSSPCSVCTMFLLRNCGRSLSHLEKATEAWNKDHIQHWPMNRVICSQPWFPGKGEYFSEEKVESFTDEAASPTSTLGFKQCKTALCQSPRQHY